MWCIPPKQDAAFVCAMEAVLEVYKRPIDANFPVICMDESSVQCIKEVREPLPAKAGCLERYDAEYERNGVAHLIQFSAPFIGWRRIEVTDNHAVRRVGEGCAQVSRGRFSRGETNYFSHGQYKHSHGSLLV